MDLLFLSRHYRCLPGQGDLPVATMPRKLEEIGYRGPISHEIFSDDFRASSARRIATDGMRSFLWLDEQIGSRVPRRRCRPSTESSSSSSWKIATTPASWPGCCIGLGFRRSHRHRSKDVELYRQGEVNLVVNFEDEGFPHAFYLLHGPAIAAMALRVDNAGRAAERATAMLAKPFVGPIGKGELEIPAVRGSAAAWSTSATRRAGAGRSLRSISCSIRSPRRRPAPASRGSITWLRWSRRRSQRPVRLAAQAALDRSAAEILTEFKG